MRYLLGDLSEEEETSLGNQYFSREMDPEELEIAEGELIDQYVRHELSARDEERLEEAVARSARLRERVEFAKILAQRVVSEPSLQTVTEPTYDDGSQGFWKKVVRFWRATTAGMAPAFRYALSVAVAFVLIAGAVFVWMKSQESQRLAQEQQQRQERERQLAEERRRNENAQATASPLPTQSEQPQNELPTPPPQPPQPSQQRPRQSFAGVFPVDLIRSRMTRSGGQHPVRDVPRTAKAVQFNLDVESGPQYDRYNALLSDLEDGRTIRQQNDLTPFPYKGRKHIRLEVPRSKLTNGLYNVQVDGLTASGQAVNYDDYTFRVRIR